MARVIKLAQSGYNVKTAGDDNLIYSSQWPLLPIYLQGSFTVNDPTVQTTIVNHKLGYVPAFWWFSNMQIGAWQNGFDAVYSSDNRSEFFGPTGGGVIGINEQSLEFHPQDFTAIGPVTIYYYIFLTNITVPFIAPRTAAGEGIITGSGKEKFKLAKQGKSASSNNMSDFVIHSDCRSPLIHSVNPGKLIPIGGLLGNSFRVDHNLGYNPMFFCYVKNFSNLENNNYELVPTGSGGSTLLQSNTNSITFQNGVAQAPISILVLKDPFKVIYTRSVTI